MRTCELVECKEKHYAKGYCYKHWRRFYVHGDPYVDKRRKLTDLQVLQIRECLKCGMRMTDVAKRFNTSYQSVANIKVGRYYKHVKETTGGTPFE